MDRAIPRRNFIQGVGCAVAAASAGLSVPALADPMAPYPPARTGMRGNHDGAFDVAHELARERRTDWGPASEPDGTVYDLIVVGAGISGLAAAHFFQKSNPDARILLLDNHDDFGGHAKRNELAHPGGVNLGHGGSQNIAGPWRGAAKELLADLRIDRAELSECYDADFATRWGLSAGLYFDRQTYGRDQVVNAQLIPWHNWLPLLEPALTMERAVPDLPLSDDAKRQLLGLYAQHRDQIPRKGVLREPGHLNRISYIDFLRDHMGVTDPQALGVFQYAMSDAAGMDLLPALWALAAGMPGLGGTSLGNVEGLIRGLVRAATRPYTEHFPDGNASIARMLVRRLIPGVAPGDTMFDVVGARFDYAHLDLPDSPVRLRLNSTAVRVQNVGDAASATQVDVTYVRGGETYRVRGRGCVLACYNRVIPHLCPELPATQREALSKLVKMPLVYTNVLLRNWRPWQELGVAMASCPGSWHKTAMLDMPVSMGDVVFSASPDDPIVVHMHRMPSSPGLPLSDQNRIGRYELYTTPFEAIEREIRTHLAGMLGSAGFDPALDIEAITVNRWSHGYAWTPLPTFSDDTRSAQPFVTGRQPFGRIAIANSDAGGMPEAQVAVEQAHRAVRELGR
jgi:spermidine dehydrogenase